MLQMWERDRSTVLTSAKCVASFPATEPELVRDVHAWLARHGAINYGALKGADLEPEHLTLEADDAGRTDGAPEGGSNDAPSAPPPAPITDAAIEARTVAFLRTADMDSTTERQIRKAVETELGADLSEKKLVIRAVVTKFLADPGAFDEAAGGDAAAADAAAEASAPGSSAKNSSTSFFKTALALRRAARSADAKPKPTKPAIVVGAGPAGLAAARMLRHHGHAVIVLEARDRVGGRVFTDADTSLSVPVDLGASIITGVAPNPNRRTGLPWLGVRADPSATVAAQLGLKLKPLGDALPLYDAATGERVDDASDARVERARDALMDRARLRVDREGEAGVATKSLADVLEEELTEQRLFGEEGGEEDGAEEDGGQNDKGGKTKNSGVLDAREKRLLGWHWANLEYGCAAPLSRISMAHWNQDEAYGGFGGAHAMVEGGYGRVTDALAEGLGVRLGAIVRSVRRIDGEGDAGGVEVVLADGETVEGAACVVTAPLGCLKRGDIRFDPPLSAAKQAAIDRLGFGTLNKIALEFPERFWPDDADYFGCAQDPDDATRGGRGLAFMFWNLEPVVHKPVLVALVAGEAAAWAESASDATLREACESTLRVAAERNAGADGGGGSNNTTSNGWKPFAPAIHAHVTRWGSDPFARGAYSFVAVGASARDYDEMTRPEGPSSPAAQRRVVFAGEHCCKEHPDTVGGAMLSGWRAARHAMRVMRGEGGEAHDEVFELVSLDDLVGDGEEDEDDASEDEDDSGDDSGDDSDAGGRGRRGRGKKKRRRGGGPGGGRRVPRTTRRRARGRGEGSSRRSGSASSSSSATRARPPRGRRR